MQTLLITGAGRGIGLATTRHFLEHGHMVYACSRNLEAIKELQKEFPDNCHPVFLDLKSNDSIEDLRKAIQSQNVILDYVIHNAGFLVNKPFRDISGEELEQAYRINVMAPFLLTQAVFPFLATNSHVVAISSMGGFQGSVKFPGLTAYSSSKAAVASLMECLQAEFAGYSQTFNSLCIGAVQTEMLQNAFPGYEAPLQPAQMAAFIYQFTTTAHHFLRGKTIPVSLSTP